MLTKITFENDDGTIEIKDVDCVNLGKVAIIKYCDKFYTYSRFGQSGIVFCQVKEPFEIV